MVFGVLEEKILFFYYREATVQEMQFHAEGRETDKYHANNILVTVICQSKIEWKTIHTRQSNPNNL